MRSDSSRSWKKNSNASFQKSALLWNQLTAHSLSEFLEAEPAIYTLADLKVRYDKPFFRKESFSKETSGRTEMRISIDALMKLTSLSEFLGAEPDIYSLADLKVRYDWIERGGQLFIR